MEFTSMEVSEIEKAEDAVLELIAREISDMQLALVGGGNLILGFN
jgi:hypothetical protein